jgi:nitrite reductase/ring-hydroxylating ferredoxin subunit/uncharacterized membrane protein
MIANYVNQLINSVPMLPQKGKQLASVLHRGVLQGGDPVRSAVDVLHGTWLGHPLHPVLTDVVVGSWVLASLFDLMSFNKGSDAAEKAADTLTAVGTAAAVPAVLSGLADYSAIRGPAAGTGLAHALLNGTSFVLYLLSLRARRAGRRDQGVALSAGALGVATVSAYLGGHLVFDQRVGVNHSDPPSGLQTWTAVLEETELAEGSPRRVEVEGNPVLLYRQRSRVYAVGAVCPHAGGPLEEGQFFDTCVQCPWHDSVYDLRNGAVRHGPSTYPVPNYEVRIRDGQIEIRATADETT